jgi:hypothetical protein
MSHTSISMHNLESVTVEDDILPTNGMFVETKTITITFKDSEDKTILTLFGAYHKEIPNV